jgi:hypothetical protein
MQTVATLLAIRTDVGWLRVAVIAGGMALAAAGAWMIRNTLTSAHFEGYALILGAMLVAQGIATIATSRPARDDQSSVVRFMGRSREF